MLIIAKRIKKLERNTRDTDERENRPLQVEIKRQTANVKKWRETHDHVVFLPFAFAVKVMLNLSNNL